MALDKFRLIASYERKIIRRHLLFWISTYLGSFLKNARLYYQVFSEEGDTYVELDLNEEAPGWIELGTYEFSEGNYFVRLSDKGGTDLQPVIKTRMLKVKGNSNITCSQMIIADAVKWVKVE